MSMNEEPLYQDKFLSLGKWLNSAILQLSLGIALALIAFIFVHWILSLVVIFFTICASLASFIVLKK